jgi:hypothetical protein
MDEMEDIETASDRVGDWIVGLLACIVLVWVIVEKIEWLRS